MSIPKYKATLLAWAICMVLFFSVGIRGYSYNAQGSVVPNRAQITSTTTYAKLGKFSYSHSDARGDILGRYVQDGTLTNSVVFAEAGIGVVGQIGLNLTDDKAKWNDNLVRGAAFGAGYGVLAKPLGGILKGVGNATIGATKLTARGVVRGARATKNLAGTSSRVRSTPRTAPNRTPTWTPRTPAPLAQAGDDLFVGTYNQVRRANINGGLNATHTPHHVLQNAISQTTHGRGITINMTKDLHAFTRTFRRPVEQGLSLRTHLARDVKDLRQIFSNAGYDPATINRQLQELIRRNKEVGGLVK